MKGDAEKIPVSYFLQVQLEAKPRYDWTILTKSLVGFCHSVMLRLSHVLLIRLLLLMM